MTTTSYFTISLLGLALVLKTIYSYIAKEKPEQKSVINLVLFFPDKEFPCNKVVHGIAKSVSGRITCNNPSCRKLHGREGESPSSLIKFLNYLTSAKHSVDLCIYLFTQTVLAEVLRDLHKSGVKVRIITDCSENDASASQLDRLRKCGIEIKSNRRGTGALMHHKFVIVDNQLLLSGSFNWTSKAVVSNYEAVLVSSEISLVEPFRRTFDIMWDEFNIHSPRVREFA